MNDDVLALFTNHPKQGDVASFNQALCGLYAAGLGYAEQAPAKLAAPAAQTDTAMTDVAGPAATMTVAQFAELGRHLVDVVQHGVHPQPAVTGSAPPAAEPVVVTGAALGLPGVERVFDDENIARILDGQQFIDTIPHKLRREMLDRHITRLVKRESGGPDVRDHRRRVGGHQAGRPQRAAGRGRASSASTPPATPRWTPAPGSRSGPVSTRCATPGSRW